MTLKSGFLNLFNVFRVSFNLYIKCYIITSDYATSLNYSLIMCGPESPLEFEMFLQAAGLYKETPLFQVLIRDRDGRFYPRYRFRIIILCFSDKELIY